MMMTHEQARNTLQIAAEQALDPAEQARLDLHLADCTACQTYARELGNLEDALREVMQKRWNAVPHRPVTASIPKANRNRNFIFQRALQIALAPTLTVVVIFIALVLSGQFSNDVTRGAQMAVVTPTAIPTPATQQIKTGSPAAACPQTTYKSQAGDTLESISLKFSVPKEVIMQANHLETEEIAVSTNLIIPLCAPTPSLTPTMTMAHPVTSLTVTTTSHTP